MELVSSDDKTEIIFILLLDRVHRRISLFNQFFGVLAVAGITGDADAGSNPEHILIKGNFLGNAGH